ncbi:hypothetical protein [Flectobacillus longus]|uniref:hypothetical protein n=1 Tax=Flectobacillus longus TaxID=2984207 RepID=UPI0024B83804|nr:hypothetical protein [Flectobacillus longus]MDI9880879.1 hypothetical protein [Flectobacillus longus]
MIKFIHNIGDYFSSNYFDENFTSKVVQKSGFALEDIKNFNKKITPLKDRYFKLKQLIIEGRLRTKDKIFETHTFHTTVLNALGYDGQATEYQQQKFFHLSEFEVIPVRHILYRGSQPHLMIMEMQALIKEDDKDPDGLFEQRYNIEEEELSSPPQRYHRSQWERIFALPNELKISPIIINKAVSALFLLEPHLRPKYILLLAGNMIFLLEQEKWFRGSYLQLDLEELFNEATANRNANYYALFYFLLGKETLAPESEMVLLDQLDEDSHKSAYEVTKDLKEGIIHAVEALANEAIFYKKETNHEVFDETDDLFEQQMKDDCLTIIYRLLFIFYAESREDLDILPSNDAIYNRGYSLEMLRELEQVPLLSDSSLNGYFFHQSLQQLFGVLANGYRENDNGQNKSFKVRHIDSPLFDDTKLNPLRGVKFRNKVWQDIICRLSLSKEKKGKTRGRISYANLGINQLGSVYESLLAYRGFYAEQDYIEVHKAGKPEEGTFLVPRSRRDDFTDKEVLKDEKGNAVIVPKGTFVYRLSGRDRQKSASYYTPEILTECTVKYTLKPILEKLENKQMKASELLDLKLLEPAMGAAAFHNEMINQLAEAYLSYRQKEMGKRVAPDRYQEERQKVKAYIATNNVYGVDLNPTAIELGKLSLWLNVIHKDMETPFFSNRIGVGNAVVGAWLKVYPEKDLIAEDHVITDAKGKPKRVPLKKEWWEKAPKQLTFKPSTNYDKIQHNRKEDEIYHFLLPDKNMVASAAIKLLKSEHEAESKRVSEWKRDWTKPLGNQEITQVKLISEKIDELLIQHYRFQRNINVQTAMPKNVFGAEAVQTHIKSYTEKEKLADERNRHAAPYFKLKMVMDYWCSLWFWDVRNAVELPSRQQFWQDIQQILQMDLAEKYAIHTEARRKELSNTSHAAEFQMNLFAANEPAISTEKVNETIIAETEKKDIFDQNERLQLVQALAKQYFFFHPQLEFLEVFWERSGFDLIAGNPPWLKLQFEESGIISEKFPEIAIRSESAPKVRALQADFLADISLKEMYLGEAIGTEATSVFLNAHQNYPLLAGQQTNLYKCVLENGFSLLGKQGFMGLIHPESIYDDPNGQPLRKEVYQRLKYHFQFQNEMSLFAEVHHNMSYGVQVFSGTKGGVSFTSISNLFHPSTISGSFLNTSFGVSGGIKIKDEVSGKFIWNIKPHSDRIVRFTEKELLVLAKTFENSTAWDSAKLVSIHSASILTILEKLSSFKGAVEHYETRITVCFDETLDVNNGTIKRNTQVPDIEAHEMIYSGPHFYVSNPIYKTPLEKCILSSDYDIIDHSLVDAHFVARTNYIPAGDIESFPDLIKGFKITNDDDQEMYDRWIDYYKVGFRKMLGQPNERTLISAILPPKTSHTHGVVSIIYRNTSLLVETQAICSSLILDFFIKTVGAANLSDSRMTAFPLGISEKYKPYLFSRTLLLNCLNKYYAPLWEENYRAEFSQDQWSKTDSRLKPFADLTAIWTWNTPLRNWYERRQALVEIDVLTAMALGLSLSELILIYNVQFPVLQQNEDDTWYDQRGNIVFTCSKGLTGVGVDRPVWEKIRNLSAGDTYEHTIEKSELYAGQTVLYYAPFEKCDRVADYEKAWAWFEQL